MVIGVCTIYALISLLLPLLALPLIRGAVNRNSWYGFRTPSTLRSDHIWYPANKASGYFMSTAGIFSFFSIVGITIIERAEVYPVDLMVWAPAILVGSVTIGLICSFIFLYRLKSRLY